MPNTRPNFQQGGIYHIYNRGVDKRQTFMDDKDRLRFVYDLNEFNDTRAGNTARQRFERYAEGELEQRTRHREPLVNLVAFVLMPNHYHLLVRQEIDGGVSEFMKRLGGGYTGYFNIRHERTGALFQGRYKAKDVGDDQYLQHIISYIHANPAPIWKNRPLERYRWSTYPAYLGQKSWPWAQRAAEWGNELGIDGGDSHRKAVTEYIAHRQRIDELISDFVVEE